MPAPRRNVHRDVGLRAQQHELAQAIERAARTDDEKALAAAWIDASDRIVDSVGTLAHLLEKGSRAEGTARRRMQRPQNGNEGDSAPERLESRAC